MSVSFGNNVFQVVACLLIPVLMVNGQDASDSATEKKMPSSAPQAEVLEEIVITGTGTARKLIDTAVRTEVMRADDLREVRVTTLADALEYTPGLRTEVTCQNCSAPSVQMLGLPQRYVSILDDGIPNFTGLAGVYGLDQIPMALVERIEVVKGGGSSLYGPNAVAGVINVIPKVPLVSGSEIQTSYEYLDGQPEAGQPSGSIVWHHAPETSNVSWTLHGMRNFAAPVDVNGDGFTDVGRRELWAGGAQLWWQPDPEAKLRLSYNVTDEQRRGGSGDLDSAPNLALLAEEIHTFRQTANLHWTHALNDVWDYRLAYSFSDVQRNSYYGGEAALGSGRTGSPFFDPTWTEERGFGSTRNQLHIVDTAVNWRPSPEHILTLGYQQRSEHLRDQTESVGRAVNEVYQNHGLMFQHDWTPHARWNIVYGARLDRHSEVEELIVSPRLAAKYSISDKLRIRAGWSTGFRAPEIFDEDLHITNVGGELQSVSLSPHIRQERSQTLTLAPEWEVTPSLHVEAHLFHTWLTNTFITVERDNMATSDVIEFLKQNGGNSRVYGAELSAILEREAWRLELSYLEQRGIYDQAQSLLGNPGDPVDNLILTDRFTRLPERTAQIRFTYDVGFCELVTAGRLIGPMLMPHIVSDSTGALVRNRLEMTEVFFVVDLGLNKRFDTGQGTALTVSLGVKNVFNSFQGDLDRGPFNDATYIYGPRLPRLFYASLRYEF